MKLHDARAWAKKAKAALVPYCRRVEIAGSIRRGRPDCGDIELVCIPRAQMDLFGAPIGRHPGFIRTVNQWPRVKGQPQGKYTQRILPLPEGRMIKLDLFTATPANWGLILAIRTGPAGFSHKMLACNWVDRGFKSVEGMLTKGGRQYSVPEERDLFKLIGLRWIEPEERDKFFLASDSGS